MPTDAEIHAMSLVFYPTEDKMSDREFRQQKLRQLAFRMGASWALDPDPAHWRERPWAKKTAPGGTTE